MARQEVSGGFYAVAARKLFPQYSDRSATSSLIKSQAARGVKWMEFFFFFNKVRSVRLRSLLACLDNMLSEA